VELPKLSQFTRVLATPEEYFENTVKSSLNIEVPPGPMSVLFKLQTAVESGELPQIERIIPLARVPRLQDILASIPKLPPVPAGPKQRHHLKLKRRGQWYSRLGPGPSSQEQWFEGRGSLEYAR